MRTMDMASTSPAPGPLRRSSSIRCPRWARCCRTITGPRAHVLAYHRMKRAAIAWNQLVATGLAATISAARAWLCGPSGMSITVTKSYRVSLPQRVWSAESIRLASDQQVDRYEGDPWQEVIAPWLETRSIKAGRGSESGRRAVSSGVTSVSRCSRCPACFEIAILL
jgi:hypothetical protein